MAAGARASTLVDDPLWYKDAIVYELHVRAFADSNGDGIGDARGLIGKLDYLAELGVTTIWLLPFYPSPLRDDGYDIVDYRGVHEAYGSLRDMRELIRQAHRRGLRVVTELVCNHTSDQHPWFQRARTAKADSVWRNFYVWSDQPDRYRDVRIIFQDFENSNWAWDPVARAYYWHRFYAHQPDLNFDSPAVRRELMRVLDFWLRMGVDGVRLDAVPYLYEREGTNCENLPETHRFLRDLRRHVDERFRNRMILAEANQWPDDAAAYFGQGDEVHMAFHFPVMPRLFMAIHMEDRFPVMDIMAQTPVIPETAQWALFLRNHDELTLEMVTEEERSYMWRVYAEDPQARINLGIRRRLAPLLGNHRRRIELMNGLLLSLPGTPVIYYGDEIGMGDNIYLGDRNAVRTPMQWSADRNAGFSTANRQRLYLPVIVDPEYHYEAVNVEAQRRNPHSLLAWMRRLIALRKQYRAFGRGELQWLQPANRKVLAFVRHLGLQRVLVVANLSRFAQYVEVDLSEYQGLVPVELFGRVPFRPIDARPYVLTLGPHNFYWFALEPAAGSALPEARAAQDPLPPLVEVEGPWTGLLQGEGLGKLEAVLPAFVRRQRWFAGKTHTLRAVSLLDVVPVGPRGCAAVVRAEYAEAAAETYLLPIAYVPGAWRAPQGVEPGRATIARVHCRPARARRPEPDADAAEPEAPPEVGVLLDGLSDPAFCEGLLDAVGRRRRLAGRQGALAGTPTAAWRRLVGGEALPPPRPAGAEQSNSSVAFGERLMLKLYRRLEPGVHPEVEVGNFLTDVQGFAYTPATLGSLRYLPASGQATALGILQAYVANRGDAWAYTLATLRGDLARVAAAGEDPPPPTPGRSPLARAEAPTPPAAERWFDEYLTSVRILGRRTGDLHLALAAGGSDPAFAPEPFTLLYQRSLFESMRALATQTFAALRQALAGLPPDARQAAERVAGLEGEVRQRLARLLTRPFPALRIRCHGDFHLGQVLRTEDDFVITDFEGEPARGLAARRVKGSALRDVAGMLRSLHYASEIVATEQPHAAGAAWARHWYHAAAGAYLRAYLDRTAGAPFLPTAGADVGALLEAFLLEKAVYEVGYELANRPEWAGIALGGVLDVLGA